MAFDGVNVLKDVDFDVRPGEVHGLVGENGAGKSTLVKILAGVYQPKAGHVQVNGRDETIPNPQTATGLGIALIHQEPLAFPDLTVVENIFAGVEPTRGPLGWLDWDTMHREARKALESLGLDLHPRTRMRGLSVADQQMVDMAAALSQNARVLLMDEPTSALTPSEVERLFRIVRKLRDQGTAIAFISHRLEEVFAISDRITVMRDGAVVGERLPEDACADDIIHLMVGRPLKAMFEKPEHQAVGEVLLEAEGLSCTGCFRDVSLSLRAGEIVGMAGLVGAGRSYVAQALFGILPLASGTIRLDGRSARIRAPRDAMNRGIAYVPEDRQHQGLLMPMSVTQNMTLPMLPQLAQLGWIRGRQERQASLSYVDRLRIILRAVEQPVSELSGGNQQKVVLSKWLLTKPRIIILDEPTRGIDVGAKAEVHRLMGELAAQGIAILMISSELPEVLAMSDRVLVMREGRLVAELDKNLMSAERIMAAATGQIVESEELACPTP
jgi:rhamnose transport system ATP-binding protein